MLDWLARTDGAGGAFIAANRHPSGGNCFVLTTPGGEKLAGGNGPGGAREALEKGLEAWKRLPADERSRLPPGTELAPPELERVTPPRGGLVLASSIRNLKALAGGRVAPITPADLADKAAYPEWNPIYTEPARYHVWLTEAEWRSLIPPEPAIGRRLRVPAAIEKRLFRYHLVNGTFGLPGRWRLEDIRAGELTLVVEALEPRTALRIEGFAQLATDGDLERAERGYLPRLYGRIEYDAGSREIERFDLVSLGDYWGGDYEGGRFRRPGRTPLGIAFELRRPDSALDRAPPLVHMDRREEYERYCAAERP
jgi:hypothetical protein